MIPEPRPNPNTVREQWFSASVGGQLELATNALGPNPEANRIRARWFGEFAVRDLFSH